MAGSSAELFAPHALQAIAAACGGIPRNVNTICFNALTLAYARNHSQVKYEDVAEVLWDLELSRLGSHNFDVAELSAPSESERAQEPAPLPGPVLLPQPERKPKPRPHLGPLKIRYRSTWAPLARFFKSFGDQPNPAPLIGKDQLHL